MNVRARMVFFFLFFLILFEALPGYPQGAPYDLKRMIPLRFTHQGADTLGWDKGTGWTTLTPFVSEFNGYLSMGNVPLKVSVPATLVMECTASQIYAGTQAPCRAWIESSDDTNVKELSSNYGFSLGIKFRDWWTETELANIGKDFAFRIEDDGRMPLGSEYLCGMDAIEFASLPIDWLIPGSGAAAKAVKGIFSTIGDSGVDLNMASLNIAGELVVEGNYVRLLIGNSDIEIHGFRDPVVYPTLTEIKNAELEITGFNDPNVKPFALTIPSARTLSNDPNYYEGSNSMFYEPIIQYSINLYNSAGFQFTLVPPLSFSIMASAVDKGENIMNYACPDSSTLHNGTYYNRIADDFKISSDLNTTVSFPLTDAPDLPDLAVTEIIINGEPKGKAFVNEWTSFQFKITNIGNRDTQGSSATPPTPEPLFHWYLWVDGQKARDIFGEEIYNRKLDDSWIDRWENPAIVIRKNESYLITGFTHRFTTEGPHTVAVTIGYNEYKTTENGRPVYGIGDYNIANNYLITFPLYVQAPRGTVQGVIETNPCGGDCGVNGVRVCLREAAGGSYNECQTTDVYQSETGPRNGVYRFANVSTGDYYLEYLPTKPTPEQVALGYPAGAYWAPRSFYFHHEGDSTDDFNYSTVKSGMRIYQYQNLKGYVKGSDGNALSGVTVRFGDVGPSATTDESGLFVFPDVPPFQPVTLNLSHPAYKTKKIVFGLSVSDSSRRETTISGDGSWTPAYWDSDVGDTSGRIAMAADTTAPTLYLDPLADQGFAGDTLAFRLRSSDGDKETYQYRYLIYDGDTLKKEGLWTTYTAPEDPESFFEGVADWTGVALSDKAYSLVVEVQDGAGNITATEKIPFTKDTTAPVITAVLMNPAGGDTAATYSKEVDVQITIGNTETGTLAAELSNDGGATWAEPVLFTGAATTIRQWRVTELDNYSGTKTVHVRVADLAGNAVTASDSINVDTTGAVYLAWGARFTNDTHVPLSIDIVPPDGSQVYTESPISGEFFLGMPANQYRAQTIIPETTLTFNKIALSYSQTGSPSQPFTGAPEPLHVKIVTGLLDHQDDPTCSGCTTLLDWSADRDAILNLSRTTTGGLPIYSSQMVTLNPGTTYYLLIYTESASDADYYMLYANDYGDQSMPSYIYASGWQTAPPQGMMNRIPHISFHLWNNDPGQIRIAEGGDCASLTDQDWQNYVYPALMIPYTFVDLAAGTGWKTVCVEYRNLSYLSPKDRSYYASVFLDTTLPTATTDTVKLVKVDPKTRKLYFDIAADDASGSGVEWITWTVPGYAQPTVPYQSSLIIDASTLPAFSAVTFTFRDRAGNESDPLNIPLKPEDDFLEPTLNVTINDSGGTGFTTSPTNNTFHFSAVDNVALAKIVFRETDTGKTSEVALSGTSANVDVPVVLPVFNIEGVDTVLDGTYGYSAYAVDAAGNQSGAVHASITLDSRAPSLGGLYLTGSDGRSTAVSSNMIMGFQAKDGIGPMTMRYRINAGVWQALQVVASGQQTFSIAGPEPLPQSYQVDVELKDGAGNTTSASAAIRTNRPPATPVGGSPSGTAFTAAPRITPSPFYDADGDALAASWFIVRKADDLTVIVNTAPLYGSSGYTLSLTDLSYDVQYTWSARYLDSFGQWSAWSTPVSFVLKRPTLTVTRNGAGVVESMGTGIECDDVFKDCTEVYDPGAIVTLQATPASGFEFTGWSGACSGAANCRLSMDADKAVTASFAATSAPLPADLDNSGEVDLADAVIALQIQAGLPDPHDTLSADVNLDRKIGLPEALYALQVLSDLRDSSLPSLTILKPGNGMGTVISTPAGIDCGDDCAETYQQATTVTLTASADSDSSTFAGWIGVCTGTGECTLTVDAMKTAGAVFALKTWTLTPSITPSDGSGGTIAPASAVTVDQGASQTFTITPGSGYHLADVVVDGASVGAVTSYTFTNVTDHHTIAASFSMNQFTITASTEGNGVILPSGTVTVNQGTIQAFTITPDAGYHVADVLVNGVSLGAVTSHTFTNVTANHTIAVSFSRNAFTITARADDNGAISPSGVTTVNQGDAQTFTITPAAGYHVADVVVDGVSVGAVTSYAFSNVTANHTIAATFAADEDFSPADLAGAWRLNGITTGALGTAPYGTIVLDGEGWLTDGSLTYPPDASPQTVKGEIVIDPHGVVISGHSLVLEKQELAIGDGKMAPSKTFMTFLDEQSGDGSRDLMAAVREGGTFGMTDFSGSWRLFGFRSGEIGPLTGSLDLDLDGSGKLTGGSLTYPGEKPIAIAGGFMEMDSGGVITAGGLDVADKESLTILSGKMDPAKAILIFTDQGKWCDLFLAIKTGGTFTTPRLSGTWHINGMDMARTFKGIASFDEAGNVRGGFIDNGDGPVAVVEGNIAMDAAGVIRESGISLEGASLTIETGKMTPDGDVIVLIAAIRYPDLPESRGFMLLIRSQEEEPR